MRKIIVFICCVSLVACGPTEEEQIIQAKKFLQDGLVNDAIIVLNEIIDKNPDSQPAYNMRGIARLEIGNIELAIEDLSFSVALDSNDYRAIYNRGNAYYQIEKYQEAIRDFDTAIRLEPKESDIYINRGNALVQLENYQSAILDYAFALKLDEENYLTHFNLARTYYLMNSIDLAKNSFERCVQIYSSFAPAYYFLGMIALERDELEASCLLLQQASDLGYQQATEVMKLYCNLD